MLDMKLAPASVTSSPVPPHHHHHLIFIVNCGIVVRIPSQPPATGWWWENQDSMTRSISLESSARQDEDSRAIICPIGHLWWLDADTSVRPWWWSLAETEKPPSVWEKYIIELLFGKRANNSFQWMALSLSWTGGGPCWGIGRPGPAKSQEVPVSQPRSYDRAPSVGGRWIGSDVQMIVLQKQQPIPMDDYY